MTRRRPPGIAPPFGWGATPHSPRRRQPSRWASDNCRWLFLDDLQGGRSRPIPLRSVVQCRGRHGLVPPAIRFGALGRNTVPRHPGKITYRSWVGGAVPCRLRVRNGIAVLLVSDPHDPEAAARGPDVSLKTVFLDAQVQIQIRVLGDAIKLAVGIRIKLRIHDRPHRHRHRREFTPAGTGAHREVRQTESRKLGRLLEERAIDPVDAPVGSTNRSEPTTQVRRAHPVVAPLDVDGRTIGPLNNEGLAHPPLANRILERWRCQSTAARTHPPAPSPTGPRHHHRPAQPPTWTTARQRSPLLLEGDLDGLDHPRRANSLPGGPKDQQELRRPFSHRRGLV